MAGLKIMNNIAGIIRQDFHNFDYKDSVVAATIASFTMASAASTNTLVLANSEGGFNNSANTYTVDGISLTQGQRVLIKDGVNSASAGVHGKWNGIYTVGDLTATSLTLTRAEDFGASGEIHAGCQVHIERGGTNADSNHVVTTDGTITVGTTAISFTNIASVSLNSLTAASVNVANDSIAIIDADDSNASRKESIADLATAMAGNGLTASSGAFAVGVDDTTIELNSDAVRVKDAGITPAKMADVAANSLLVRNAGSSGVLSAQALTSAQILIGNGSGFTAAALSGDVTMSNAGAVTIGNDKVTPDMISHASGVDAAVTNVLSYTSGNVVQWAPLARVCFLKGTKITLPDKSQKNIEDLKLGELVLTYNINNLSNLKKDKKHEIMNWSNKDMKGEFSKNRVKNIWVNPADRYLVINDKLRVTNLHIIHVKRGEEYKFLPAEKAQIGDLLFTDKDSYEPIHTIEQVDEKTEVYNIEVRKARTYFADNYLVHHFCETCSGLSGRI